jgi:AraC family transcriptional regulator
MDELKPAAADRRPLLVRFSPAEIARHRTAASDGIRIESVEITQRQRFDYGFKAPMHLLTAAEEAERDDGETLVEGLPRSTLRSFSGRLTFIPAGHTFYGWQDPRLLMRVTYFYIDPRAPLFGPELGLDAAELKPRLFFFDHDLWETTRKLKAHATGAGLGHRAYVNALSIVLVHELMRINDGPVHAGPVMRGGLAGWQQKRIAEFIEEHVADDISLAQLAELARLSPYHFARAFKQSFGVPPHRYHTGRRVERAKTLLAKPDLSVTEIGLAVGFSETSSFSAAFRKLTGTTPTTFRRSRD